MANCIPNEKLEKIKNKFVKTQVGRNNEFRKQMGKTNMYPWEQQMLSNQFFPLRGNIYSCQLCDNTSIYSSCVIFSSNEKRQS